MMSNNAKSSIYKNIIIDFLFKDNSFSTNAKCLSTKYTNTTIINEREFTKKYSLPANFDKPVRIYIVGHCFPASDFLMIDDNKSIFYKDLASDLAHFIGNHHNVTINLISCEAGASGDETIDNSFAAKLHKELVHIKKKDIPVVARKFTMVVYEGNSPYARSVTNNSNMVFKATSKSEISIDQVIDVLDRRNNAPRDSAERDKLNTEFNSMYVRHQPGSKVIFMMDKDNNQICADAYLYLWRSHLFQVLKQRQATTGSLCKQELLKTWDESFKDLSDEQICETINNELGKFNSPLKKHTNPISWLFKESKSVTDFKKLLKEREEFVKGQSPLVKTGISFSNIS